MSTRAKVIVAGVIVAALVGLVILDLSSAPRDPGRRGTPVASNDRTTVRTGRTDPGSPTTPRPVFPSIETRPLAVDSAPAVPTPVVDTAPSPSPIEPEIVEVVTAPTPAPVQAARTYEVRAGDSLWVIAEAQYGNGAYHTLISAANPGINPNSLVPGTVLTIPPRPQRTTAPAPVENAGERMYTIQQGDTLEAIALRYYQNRGLASAIYEVNRDTLRSPDVLVIGHRIRVPENLNAERGPVAGAGRVERAPAGANVYTVQSGDSLWKIARQHADGRPVNQVIDDIVTRNRDRLTQGANTILQPGWQIVLP